MKQDGIDRDKEDEADLEIFRRQIVHKLVTKQMVCEKEV